MVDFEHEHERLGYGKAEVGQVVQVPAADRKEATRLRANISSHGRYHGKRFKTRQKDGILYIKRVE